MPAIRDHAVAYTSAAGTTITVPMPNSELNDLLLAFLSADTGIQNWTSIG